MKKYVVVYNTSETIPIIKHIISWDINETLEDLKKWYYEYFTKLNGDEFKVFETYSKLEEFEEKLQIETEEKIKKRKSQKECSNEAL